MARPRAGTTQRPWTRGRESARAAALTTLLVLTSCTGSPPAQPGPSAEGDQVALRITTAPGGARGLSSPERTGLESAVGEMLSRYLVNGFLGEYPRERFVESFDDFTSGGAALAARDIGVLTASRVGDATDVRPRTLEAELYFLVDDGDVLGATAHLDLALEATMAGGESRTLTRTGRLMLTEERGRWSVFGFDVAGDDGAPVGEESP